ncbi:MAG TPA: hypothetical protein VFE58_10430 [Tepidisphaeraceae bacterium]|jgi:hypothetical protein|nr:hypothetical protein [Tepidisphaeraceae bacterium]
MADENHANGSVLLRVLAIGSIFLSVAASITVSSGRNEIYAGEINATPPFISVSDAVWIAIWIFCTGIVITFSISKRGSLRRFCAGGLVAIFAAVPFSCEHRRYPDEAYLAGFMVWSSTHVDPVAIRKWQDSLVPTTKPILIPAAQYPAVIASLAPDMVEQRAEGIVIQWGRQATWSSSRKVFIPNPESAGPPADLFHLWHQVVPGLYAARGMSD